jgi:hypothetical protein
MMELPCGVACVSGWLLLSCGEYLMFLPLFHDDLIMRLIVKMLSLITGFAEKSFRMIKSGDMDLDTSGFQRLEKNRKYWALSLFGPSNFTSSVVALIAVLKIIVWLFAGLLRWVM